MSFRRTDFGISNLRLFHGVDAVVFVEGGETTYTVEQLSQGLHNSQADDLKYWQIVFTTFAGKRALHFRAVGSKTTIKELAALIIAGQVKHILVAMDRDFDHLTRSLPTGAGILSTNGYSWENDVWTSDVVFATFKKFNTSPQIEKQAEKLIDQEFANARTKLRCCVRADAILSSNSLEPLPRDKLEKILRPVKGGAPTVSLEAAKSVVRGRTLKTRPARLYGPKVTLNTLRDCYGHLLGSFGYHLLAHVLRKFCGITVAPRQLLVPAAIDAFAAQLPQDPTLGAHYTALFAAIIWAT